MPCGKVRDCFVVAFDFDPIGLQLKLISYVYNNYNHN